MATTTRMALTMHEQRLLKHWTTGEPLERDLKSTREYLRGPEVKQRPVAKIFRWPE